MNYKFPALNKCLLFIMILLYLLIASCSEKKNISDSPAQEKFEITKMAVISDVHYFDPALGTGGPDFEAYLKRDRKMLAESESILKSAINSILSEDVGIVLISGDLTKDGEYSSHVKLAGFLQQLKAAGKKVYVVPGNHDINNFGAYAYSSSGESRVPNISPEQFAAIYNDFGFSEAIYRDSSSLSYIVEPVKDLWIFGMDDCKYNENTNFNTSAGGAFSISTMNWLLSKLQEAKTKNKTVIGFVHHSILEHFNGEKSLLNDYVIDNWEKVSNDLADNGMNAVFTGHFHAQDIVKKQFSNNNFLYDIETGALVTYPVPYRIVNLYSDGSMVINSKRIAQIDYNTNGLSFQDYAKGKLELNGGDILNDILINRIKLTQSEINDILPTLVSAFVAYAAGDESPTNETIKKTQSLMESSDLRMQLIGNALNTFTVDLPPADNNIQINIKTGETKNLSKLP